MDEEPMSELPRGPRQPEQIEQPVLRQDMYDVLITPLDYGFIVKVGCKRFALESRENLIRELTAYINNPGETVRGWREKL